MKKNKTQADIEWENRTLCVDEGCIGVVGPDGRCKECGKSFESGSAETASQAPTEIENQKSELDAGVTEETARQPEESEDDSPVEIDWGNRTLCVDESCIGVIGPDGRCKECGKLFESK